LYEIASALNNITAEEDRQHTERVIEAYNLFLSKNPKDHRKVPEALYSLSSKYLNSDRHSKAREFYHKALDAEEPENRLPCFPEVTIITKNLLSYGFGTRRRR